MMRYLYFILALTIVNRIFAFDLSDALEEISKKNITISKEKTEISRLEIHKSYVRNSYGEKLYIQGSFKRDRDHLNEVYINDLNQRNFNDYSFSQSNYSLRYEGDFLNKTKKYYNNQNQIDINQNTLLLQKDIESLENRTKLIFSKLYYLAEIKKEYSRKKDKLEYLFKLIKGQYENSLVKDDYLLAKIKRDNLILEEADIDRRITFGLNDLAEILNEEIRFDELELGDPEEIHFYCNICTKDFDEKVIENKVEKLKGEKDYLKKQHDPLNVFVGVKYFNGQYDFDANIDKSFNWYVQNNFSDKYGSNGTYLGIYGSDAISGEYFYFGAKYDLIGKDENDFIREKEKQIEFLEYQKKEREIEAVTKLKNLEADTTSLEKNIKYGKKAVMDNERLSRQFDERSKFQNVDPVKMYVLQNELFNEKIRLYDDQIKLKEKMYEKTCLPFEGINVDWDEK